MRKLTNFEHLQDWLLSCQAHASETQWQLHIRDSQKVYIETTFCTISSGKFEECLSKKLFKKGDFSPHPQSLWQLQTILKSNSLLRNLRKRTGSLEESLFGTDYHCFIRHRATCHPHSRWSVDLCLHCNWWVWVMPLWGVAGCCGTPVPLVGIGAVSTFVLTVTKTHQFTQWPSQGDGLSLWIRVKF